MNVRNITTRTWARIVKVKKLYSRKLWMKLTEGVRAIQVATEEVQTHIDNLQRDSCARDGAQERRIKQMQEGLARFLERCDPRTQHQIDR